MGCMDVALIPDNPETGKSSEELTLPLNKDIIESRVGYGVSSKGTDDDHTASDHRELLFRCLTCKRIAHYKHLSLPPHMSEDNTLAEIAQFYTQNWLCADCSSYKYGVDKILAWRPYPPNAVDPLRPKNEPQNYKNSLPREYLVKWLDRSYRRVQWVPHMWLVSTHYGRLRNFLSGGSKVELLKIVEEDEKMLVDEQHPPTFDIGNQSRASSTKPGSSSTSIVQEAVPDAERRIPPAWKTIDRVLDLYLWSGEEYMENERRLAFDQGEQPGDSYIETISQWESRTERTFSVSDIEQVVWTFLKWDDLGYDDCKFLPDFTALLSQFLQVPGILHLDHQI